MPYKLLAVLWLPKPVHDTMSCNHKSSHLQRQAGQVCNVVQSCKYRLHISVHCAQLLIMSANADIRAVNMAYN
jgi:hypothetical protein